MFSKRRFLNVIINISTKFNTLCISIPNLSLVGHFEQDDYLFLSLILIKKATFLEFIQRASESLVRACPERSHK